MPHTDGYLVNYKDEYRPSLDTIRGNFGTTEDYLSDIYFRRILTPSEMQLTSNSVNVDLNGATRLMLPGLPNAVTSVIDWTVRRPEYWSDGILKVTWIGYTGNVAGNNFVWNYLVRAFPSTAALQAAAANSSSETLTSAGPGAIFVTVNKYDTSAFIVLTPDMEYIGFRMSRTGADAADTNTGDMYFTGARLEYVPRLINCDQK